jgi:hypothetical protein
MLLPFFVSIPVARSYVSVSAGVLTYRPMIWGNVMVILLPEIVGLALAQLPKKVVGGLIPCGVT